MEQDAVARARDRALGLADMNVFISLSNESGSGPVVAVKDVVDVHGMVTTAGGIVLPAIPADADAPVITRLRKRGHAVVGKANMHEFALGPTSENPHYGPVRNPRDRARVAGGSSGGSAAAVALGLCDWAMGSDSGGSIRIPAALCGVVGLKPSVGLVPVAGTFPVSKSLDTLGPLAADVRSAAFALEAMSGQQALVPAPDDVPDAAGLRLAVPAGWGADLSPEVDEPWRAVTDGLPRIGFPDLAALRKAGATILRYEAAAVHREYLAQNPSRYGQDVRDLLTNAQAISHAEYRAAQHSSLSLRAAVEDVLRNWDAVLAPVCRTNPCRFSVPSALTIKRE